MNTQLKSSSKATIGHWIGGAHVAGAGTRTADVYDPAKGSVVAQLALGNAQDVDAAVRAARAALPAWSATPALRRARILSKCKDLVERHAEELARLISSEHGKTWSDARGRLPAE